MGLLTNLRPRQTNRRTASPIVIALVAVAAVVVGLVVWDRGFRTASPDNPGTTCPTLVRPTGHQPLAAIGIHRVALIGDSIMNEASCSIAEDLAPIGVETGRYAVNGTGLLNGQVDWLNAMSAILRDQHPDAVLAIFIGNYPAPPAEDRSGHPILDNTPEFFAAWQQRAEQLSALVRASGATMYWVSPPPMPQTISQHVRRLFDGYASIPGDRVIGAGSSLAGSQGGYTLYKQSCGRRVLLRSLIDGVHLTDQGARIYGEEIAHDLSGQHGVVVSPAPC